MGAREREEETRGEWALADGGLMAAGGMGRTTVAQVKAQVKAVRWW